MTFPAYCSVLLSVAAAFVISTVDAKLTLEGSRELSGPLTNLQIHNDLLYIGGTNEIYALDKNLKITSSANTCDGKVQDCNNINKVLVADPFGKRLITCGTGKGGICEVRVLNDLSNVKVQSSNVSGQSSYLVVSTDLDKPAVGMVTSNEKFIIAVTFGNGVDKYVAVNDYYTYTYAISTRHISTLRADKTLNLEIHKEVDLENYIIYYKKSFQHAGYSYFVTNQKKKVDLSSSEYVSKFIRLCQNDTEYRSYADVVITCESEYNFIQDVILITSNNGSKMLMGIFTKSQELDKNSGDSVICGINFEVLNNGIEKAKENFFYNSCSDRNNKVRYLQNHNTLSDCPEAEFPSEIFHCESAFDTFRYVTDSTSYKFKMMFRLDAVDGTLTSLSSTKMNDESSVILAGTSTGNVIMMNFRNTSLTKYYIMSVDSWSTKKPVRAVFQEDDDTLYVMTTDRISKYASSNCSEFTTCEATMKGKNPLCGWCIFENRATRKGRCTTGFNHWLSSLTECIQLNLDPKGTPTTEDSTENSGTVKILAVDIPDHQHSYSYKCVFLNGTKRIAETEAVRSGNNFECKLPQVSIHTKAMLELVVAYSDQYVALAQAPFLFYDCQTYMKCRVCVNTDGARCQWSISEPGCGNTNNAGITKEVDCPKLENNIAVNFIPINTAAPIKLRGSNLPTISADIKFWCYVPAEEGAVKEYVEATVKGDEIICSIEIDSAEKAKKDVRVHIKYGKTAESRKYLDDDYMNTVTVYECAKLASDCSHCKGLNKSRYRCGWCSEYKKCLYENCDDRCPRPTITQIVPTDGPVEGNTLVTISGRELGSQISEINIVKIGDEICNLSDNITDYNVPISDDFTLQVPTRLVCRTKELENDIAGQPQLVTVKVHDSVSRGDVTFTYKKVKVTGVMPSHGPKSGGTLITLSGENLGVGNRIWLVILGSQICKSPKVKPYAPLDLLIKHSNHYSIECETGFYSSVANVSILSLIMDKQVVFRTMLTPKFRILANPNISDITGSKSGFLSGGTVLTVIGNGMNNANKAVVKYIYKGEDVQDDCVIKSPEMTECLVPKASENLSKDLMRKVNNTDTNGKKTDTCSGCLDIAIVVKLDGVEKGFVFRYYRNPSIDKFGNDGDVLLYGTDERQLILSGESLNLVATKYDFKVTIGVENCTVIDLTEDTLRCFPPSDQPAPVDTKNRFPEVNVNVGNIRVHVGYLEYEKKVELIAIIAGATAGGLIIAAIIFVVGFIKYRKVVKKVEGYEKSLSDMEMEIRSAAK